MSDKIKSLNVLIIDDNQTMRDELTNLVEKVGVSKINTAASGKDAIKYLLNTNDTADQVSLILLDIMMPEMTGIEFLKVAKEYYRTIPIVMVTAEVTIDNVVESQKHGSVDFIAKPFNLDILVEKLENIFKD